MLALTPPLFNTFLIFCGLSLFHSHENKSPLSLSLLYFSSEVMNKERQSDVDREHGIDDEDDCDDYSDNKEDSDVDDDGDVKQEVMQKDGQSESEREHDEGGGTTYQSGQSSRGSFLLLHFSPQ